MSDLAEKKIDIKAIFSALALPIIFWGFSVGAISALGYPGVVCITPIAWLLSFTVGQTSIHRSRSLTKSLRVREAAIGGGMLGVMQGLLFIVISSIGLDVAAGEISRTLLIGVIMTLVGAGACAIISAAFANYIEKKQAELTETK
jgi:hypothetical protein